MVLKKSRQDDSQDLAGQPETSKSKVDGWREGGGEGRREGQMAFGK